MNLTLHTPIYLLPIIFLAAYAVAFFLYLHTVPTVSRGRRYVLSILRGTALAFVLLAICEPLLQLITTEQKRPVVALLADNSLSMSQTDNRGSKEERIKTFLSDDALQRIAASADLRFYSFSHAVAPVIPESLKIDGGATDISLAITSSLKTIEDLQTIILLSDGNYNTGANPLYSAEKSRVPIFTIGVGDTLDQKDVSVSRLATNSVAYVEATIPVDVTVRSSGMAGRSVDVLLFEDDKKIAEQRISIPVNDGISETAVQFFYTPSIEGIKKMTVRISGAEGEITEKNNSRSAIVKVLKSKMNILVLAGTLNADVSAVMQTLNSDPNIKPYLFYQLPGGELVSPVKDNSLQRSLPSSDAVVLIGFPARQPAANDADLILSTIAQRSIPVLFINARTVNLRVLRSMEPLLPFTIASERNDEQSILPNVVPEHKFHQLLRVGSEAWEKLPPVYYSLPSFSAKPEAQTLVAVKVQNIPLQNPLVLVRNVGNRKSVAILGYGIHRWKVLAGTDETTREFFDQWFSSLLRWLAVRERDKFVRVEPSKEFFSRGEAIGFSGQVYDESYRAVENADVRLSLHSLQRDLRFETVLTSIGSGLYEGSAHDLSEGDYAYEAVAVKDGDTLGTAKGRISVGEQSIEYAETKMNKPLMQRIAASSGGEYFDVTNTALLADKILSRPEMKPFERVRTSEFELWNLPSFLAIIILLFGIEWFIRKRSGML